jgi:hypothetical protein
VSRRLVTLLSLALAALALGACGNRQERVLHGATEGIYIDVGDLKYQVQISRVLNPNDREDRAYLVDLPADQKLGADENWFAVFMRVENNSDKAAPATDAYSIKDTQGNVYKPVSMGPKNVFAYRPAVLQPEDILPLPSTAAAESTIQGSMVLFKIPVANFQNRPLELQIPEPDGGGETGTVDLDV